jgi:hypothetical protein
MTRGRRRAISWLIVLLVLVGLLIGADRVSAVVASNTAATYLGRQAEFGQRPSVHIHGFPFLTQAVAGRYDDIDVHAPAVELDGVRATDLRAVLRGVHLPLSDILGSSVASLPVDSATGSVTFSYGEVAQFSQIPGLTLTDVNGALRVTATLSIPGTSVTAAVSGAGTARIESQALRLTVTQLTVAGLSLPTEVLTQLAALLAVPIPIPALPYGLQIDGVTPVADGLLVSGNVNHVVITKSGPG